MRLATQNKTRPRPSLPLRPADVLMVCPDSNWWRIRCHMRIRLLEKAGLSVCLYQPPNNSFHGGWDAVQIVTPKLIISHAEAIDGMNLSRLADHFPNRIFAAVNHSSQSHLARSAHGLKSNAAHVAAAISKPNYIYCSPDERIPLAPLHSHHPNLQWAPNPVRIPDKERAGRPGKDALLIAGRHDVVKNLPQQMMAASLVQQETGCDVLVTVKQPNAQNSVNYMAAAYGLRLQFVPWMDWRNWIEFINARVTVCMQASYSESFNYVALENMLCGRPVVGSPAIRYMPEDWQANPEDVESMATIAIDFFKAYRMPSDHARQQGTSYARWLNSEYTAWAKNLFN